MTQKSTEIVGLVGATGVIRKSVAVALRRQGRHYRAIGRSRIALEKQFGGDPLADIATWDLDDEESIKGALQGIAAVVYMVGVHGCLTNQDVLM